MRRGAVPGALRLPRHERALGPVDVVRRAQRRSGGKPQRLDFGGSCEQGRTVYTVACCRNPLTVPLEFCLSLRYSRAQYWDS